MLFTGTNDISTPPGDQYVLEITLYVLFLLCLNICFVYLLVDQIKNNNNNEQKCSLNTTLYDNISKNQIGKIILSKL